MFGRSSELQMAGIRDKILCRTKSARCSKMKENVPMGGEGVKKKKKGEIGVKREGLLDLKSSA